MFSELTNPVFRTPGAGGWRAAAVVGCFLLSFCFHSSSNQTGINDLDAPVDLDEQVFDTSPPDVWNDWELDVSGDIRDFISIDDEVSDTEFQTDVQPPDAPTFDDIVNKVDTVDVFLCAEHGDCAPTEYCSAGRCLPQVCTPGKFTCSKDKSVALLCLDDGSGWDSTPTVCETGGLCLKNECVPETGCMWLETDGDGCDVNPCLVGGKCEDGVCTGASPPTCEDNNPCTTNACNTDTGCTYVPDDGAVCTATDPCVVGESCLGGKCVGSLLKCEDNNPCTGDLCENDVCVYLPNDGVDCPDDGNVCTNDVCAAMECTHEALTGPPCQDDELCRTWSCVNGTCEPKASASACSVIPECVQSGCDSISCQQMLGVDEDGDSACDSLDNCVGTLNAGQTDLDGDGRVRCKHQG